MGRQRDRSQESGRECGPVPGADFQNDLPGRRRADPQQLLNLQQARPRPVAEQGMPSAALIAPRETDQRQSHSDSRKTRGDGGTVHAQRRHAELSINQNPVAEPVHKVCDQQRNRDDPHLGDALQIAPRRPVEQQRERAEIQNSQIPAGQPRDFRRDTYAREEKTGHSYQNHQRGSGDARKVNALRQPVVTGIVVVAPVGVRHQRVEPQQDADAE